MLIPYKRKTFSLMRSSRECEKNTKIINLARLVKLRRRFVATE